MTMKVTAPSNFPADSPQMMTKTPTKRRRQLRETETKIYLEKGSSPDPSLDVITRGGDYQQGPFKNQRFWRRILSERKSYKSLSKYEDESRIAIIESIYDYV